MSSKYVYFCGNDKADGSADKKTLLGGKGANLAEMTNIGLPVPPGFTITTEVCTYYYDHNRSYPPQLKAEVEKALKQTEDAMGAKFGDAKNPLLVSCRSGARESMPGMMDTVLNIGLNEATLRGLIDKTGNERFAWDSYRRFVQMYGDVVLDLKPQKKGEIDPFEHIMDELKHERGVKEYTPLTVKDLQELVKRFKKAGKEKKGKDFPDTPRWMYGATVQYAQQEFYANVQVKYTGRRYSTLANDEYVPGYTTVDLNAGYLFGNVWWVKNITLRGNISNIFDKKYLALNAGSGSLFTTNATGTGRESAPSNPITPATVPDAPQGIIGATISIDSDPPVAE